MKRGVSSLKSLPFGYMANYSVNNAIHLHELYCCFWVRTLKNSHECIFKE